MKSLFPTRLAEMIFALAIGYFGILHFMNAEIMGGMVPAFVPGDQKIWVYVTGAVLMAAALSIIINKLKAPACYLLAAMLLLFIFTIHIKTAMDGNPGQLLKDTGLAMAAIIIGNRGAKK